MLFKVQFVDNENTQIFCTTNNINGIIFTRKGKKLEFVVSFGVIKSTQVLDKLIVNLLAVHQMLSRFNSSVIVCLRVYELSLVTSKQVSSANKIGLLCNALRSLI